jgi:hypothetical protein
MRFRRAGAAAVPGRDTQMRLDDTGVDGIVSRRADQQPGSARREIAMPSSLPDGAPEPDGVAPTGPRSAGDQHPDDPQTDRALAFQPTFGTLRRGRTGPPGSVASSRPLILDPIIAIVVAIVALIAALLIAGR